MNSKSLFIWAKFAAFAFAFISVFAVGSPTKDQTYDEAPHSVGLEYLDSCEFSAPWIALLEKDISFYYYTKQNPEGKLFDFELQPVPDIFFTTETKVLTHGFRGSIDNPEFQTLISAFLVRSEPINVIALNWSSQSTQKFRDAAKATNTVGKIIASLFCVLYKFYDIYPQQMHFIGHDLGAHLLAVTARESKMKVGRITGLNPTRLCFEEQCEYIFYQQLNKNDAEFVDILHTDTKKYGIINPHGTVDFYANEGKNQPMCHVPFAKIPISDTCDSYSAYLYYAESILIPDAFYGTPCDSIYPIMHCSKSNGMYWGENMDVIATGKYNFYTRAQSPYGEKKNNSDNAANSQP